MDRLPHRLLTAGWLALATAACHPTPTGTAAPASAAESPSPQPEPGRTAPPAASSRIAVTVPAQFESADVIRASVGDIAVRAVLRGCEVRLETLSECGGGADIEISDAWRSQAQTLRVPAFHLNPEATLYRGPLDGSYTRNSVSIVLADMDGDGAEDLAIRTGLLGGYGSPSYDVYLYDPSQARYVPNPSLSELTVGRLGLFEHRGDRLVARTKSGCCEHAEETYTIENGRPELFEVVTETTDGGPGSPVRTIQRRVDGELRTVDR